METRFKGATKRSGAVVLFLFGAFVTTEAYATALLVADLFDPTFSDGQIEVIRTDGTDHQVLREVGGGLRGLAENVSTGGLFWSDVNNDRIERVERATPGGPATGIVTTGLQFPQDLAISTNSSKLFWADSLNDSVSSSNLDGSVNTLLFSADTTSVAVDDVNGKVYAEDRDTAAVGSIVRSNFDGTGFETVVVDIPTVTDIAVDGNNGVIYWTSSAGLGSSGDGGVYRVNADGTGFTELFLMGSNLDTTAIVLDLTAGFVYWGQQVGSNASSIYRMNLDGTGAQEIATGFANITKLVLTDDSYFASVPEPATTALLAIGLLGMGFARRRVH